MWKSIEECVQCGADWIDGNNECPECGCDDHETVDIRDASSDVPDIDALYEDRMGWSDMDD